MQLRNPDFRAGLPVAEAAQALGVAPGTLRRWVHNGAPCIQRGRRGRGHALLIDPDAVRTWRGADELEAAMTALAGALPELLAGAMADAHRQIEGSDKRRAAGWLAGAWYLAATAVLDHLRERHNGVAELVDIPGPIARLQQIARA